MTMETSHRALFCALSLILAFATSGCYIFGRETFCEMTDGRWVCAESYPMGPNGPYTCERFECSYAKSPNASSIAPAGTVLYVGASAHVAGAQGTNWRSDVEIHSLGDETAVFTLYKLDLGRDNETPVSAELSLEPGRSLRLDDVLDAQFDYEGAAALVAVPSAGRIMVTSRTYNLLGEGNDFGLPAGATFGQYIGAESTAEAIRFGEEARLIQLEHSTADDSGFRTNLGLVNAGIGVTGVEVELYRADATLLGMLPVFLTQNEYRQINRVFTHVTDDDVEDGYAIVRTTSPDGAFFALASVVDNLTGDPTAIPAVRLPSPEGPQYIAASAHVAGAAGTNWRTDVEVHCWSGPATYMVELLEHGANNSSPETRQLTIDAGTSVRHDDILPTLFGFEGAAALRFTPTTGEILVTSRTYNLLGEGNELGLPEGATFGQFIPAVSADNNAIRYLDEGRLIQLGNNAGDEGFRTNLVLVNAGGSWITTVVELFSADGDLLGSFEVGLKPYEYRQLNRVFDRVTSATVEDGYAVVRTTSESGAFFALASVVDNLTGDPVGMASPVIQSDGVEAARAGVEAFLVAIDDLGYQAAVDHAQSVGIDAMLDLAVAGMPDVATRTPNGLQLDYPDGYPGDGGADLSGTASLDLSGLSITPDGITGPVTVDQSDILINGEPPTLDRYTANFNLQELDGDVVGDISLIGVSGSAKNDAALSGDIEINTALCELYPAGGTVTYRQGNELITITFSPDCDGEYEYTVTTVPPAPGWDFDYSYWDPSLPESQQYIISAENVVHDNDPYFPTHLAWTQAPFGENCSDTPPGIITYKFDFPDPVLDARLTLKATVGGYSFYGSTGAVDIRVSNNGHTWFPLLSCDTGDDDPYGDCDFIDVLPPQVLGTREIWVEVELCCRDLSPSGVTPPCFFAMHSYWIQTWTPSDGNANFRLLADYTP